MSVCACKCVCACVNVSVCAHVCVCACARVCEFSPYRLENDWADFYEFHTKVLYMPGSVLG